MEEKEFAEVICLDKQEKRQLYYPTKGGVPKWLREQSAKLRCSGSNPLAASIFSS